MSATLRISDAAYIFPGARDRRPLSDMALLEVVRGMNQPEALWVETVTGEQAVPHGFRSSFRDWAGERTLHAREVIEHALAHQLKDKAEAAYQRGALFDKRRDLMADWAKWCEGKRGKVLPIRGRVARQ